MTRNQALALLCLALTGCACGPGTPTAPGTPTCTFASSTADIALGPPPQSDPVFRRGDRIDARFSWWPNVQCKEDLPDITSVTLEVNDPEGKPVAATASAPEFVTQPYGYQVWQTTVSFQATLEGPYHVLLTFDPGGGLLQKDLWVVQDATAELPAQRDLAHENCMHLERGSLGLVGCTDGQSFQFSRDGGGLQSGYGRFVVADDAVWIRNDRGVLTRSVDTGSGALQLSIAWFGVEDGSAIAARQSEVLLWDFDRLALLRFDGSALVRDSELIISGGRPVAMAYSRDAGTVALSTESGWTRLELAPGLQTVTPTWNLSERAIFQSTDGIWVTADFVTLRWVPADRTLPTLPVTGPPGWLLPQGGAVAKSGHWPLFMPVVTDGGVGAPLPTANGWADGSQALVPVLVGGAVQLRHYRAPEGATFVEVTGGALRAVRGTEQLFWPLP